MLARLFTPLLFLALSPPLTAHPEARPELGAAGKPGQAPSAKASPPAIVAAAADGEWVTIPSADLLVMDLYPRDTAEELEGRRVVIQLIGPPWSQGWVNNIRRLAAARWWDGLAVVRVQDNYVAQWGDPYAENPALARPLPSGLQKMPAADYVAGKPGGCGNFAEVCPDPDVRFVTDPEIRDSYADHVGFVAGWPVALKGSLSWPVHCYATVGVGRDLAPDTGSGAELYAVIGQAPRQLDRNIAVVGRVIKGIENLSALPRGTGELGFYASPEKRTPILSVRPASEVPDLPRYQYLSTSSTSFARYLRARANREDEFYVQPAGGVDICNVPVPMRHIPEPAMPAEQEAVPEDASPAEKPPEAR